MANPGKTVVAKPCRSHVKTIAKALQHICNTMANHGENIVKQLENYDKTAAKPWHNHGIAMAQPSLNQSKIMVIPCQTMPKPYRNLGKTTQFQTDRPTDRLIDPLFFKAWHAATPTF